MTGIEKKLNILFDTDVIAINDYYDEITDDIVIKENEVWHVNGYDDDLRVLVGRNKKEIYLSFHDFSTIFIKK